MKNFFIFIIVFYSGQNLNAQNTVIKTLNSEKSITINSLNETEHFHFLSSDKSKKTIPRLNKFYYWYKANAIHFTQGGFDGKLLHGQYTAFYLNNQLYKKGEFKKGLKEGKWTEWYPNGLIKKIEYWDNGFKIKTESLYNDKGEIEVVSRYKNNQLHGKTIKYINNIPKDTLYYFHGELKPKEVIINKRGIKFFKRKSKTKLGTKNEKNSTENNNKIKENKKLLKKEDKKNIKGEVKQKQTSKEKNTIKEKKKNATN